MEQKVLLIYPRSNKHLGLWNDLNSDNRVYLRCTDRRFMNKFMRLIGSAFIKFHNNVAHLPFHNLLFNYYDLYKLVKSIDHLVLIDGALNVVTLSELRRCRKKNPSLKISLYLINSLRAGSPILNKVRPLIGLFKWDNIFTFDPIDARDYGYTYLAFNYYSSHGILNDCSVENDAYFVGGLKGGRNDLINETYNYLTNLGVKCHFDIMLPKSCCTGSLDGVHYYHGWRPYDEILSNVNKSKCIIEITQEYQSGATLRFFEAVCMNKKLISNNENIINFPFYNPKWMKVFHTPDDIDIDWMKCEDVVDYGYNGEFSPAHLVDYLQQ